MQDASSANASATNDEIALSKKIQFGIGKRLILAFGGVGLLSVLISFVSWNGLSEMSETQADITSKDVPAISSALTLANQTSQLVASAPLLTSARTDEERTTQIKQINATLQATEREIAALSPLINDDKQIAALKDKVKKLQPIFKRLDEIVMQSQQSEAQRQKLSAQLIDLRSIAEREVSPLAKGINLKMLDISDKWIELLDQSIEKAATGEQVDYDASELEMAPLGVAQFQTSVLGFQNSANLLIGLLLEGSQSQDISKVQDLQGFFLQNIASMASPMAELAKDNEVPNLEKMFQQLLELGSKGDQNTDILKLRIRQLEMIKESETLLSQARDISGGLSTEVNKIVSTLQAGMDKAVASNNKLAKTTKTTLLIVAVVSVIVVILVGWLYILGNVVKRLLKLVQVMQSIAGGDLTTRVNRNGSDEISLMGSALALLRNGLRETDLLKQQQEEQRLKNQQLQKEQAQKLANDFDMAVGQSLSILSESVGDIRQKANAMNEISARTLKETQEVTSASQVMSEDISSVASNTEELAKSITEISGQVANSTQVAAEAVTRAAKLNGNIEQLQSGSEKIESVIGLINTIAEQTNLLALNATIEASRAGEAGKGFAVVASEVKNLANQTANAIDNISTLISDIQNEIAEAVDANAQITTIIEEIDQVSTGIAAAVEEQSAATGEISRTVQNTAAHVNTISERVVDVSDAIKDNNTMVEEVLGGVSEIDDQSSSLTEEVDHFLNDVRKSG
ncbi:methyl-accepting chemotaxis protein [Terasakiella sp. A23]|uniref:HAMP domain-containing methyl-accepting chemotaxis protein n=1 Tax=Terasakiella sp. FCG-A23 TaxID=3080561 RepID=UPI002952AFCB|nr:methyl-accepting chemotaxis protein [Terasakiella sp. A23]MDV7340089.1 methyl-accepting chemotaxis protein [Terasakiella sp. A23]